MMRLEGAWRGDKPLPAPCNMLGALSMVLSHTESEDPDGGGVLISSMTEVLSQVQMRCYGNASFCWDEVSSQKI